MRNWIIFVLGGLAAGLFLTLRGAEPAAAALGVAPIVIDFDDLDLGRVPDSYRTGTLSFRNAVDAVNKPSRSGNSLVAPCLEDANCQRTITIDFAQPLVEVSLWVTMIGDPLDVYIEAFDGNGKHVTATKDLPTSGVFGLMTLKGLNIWSIVVEVPENRDRAFFIDDLTLVEQVAAFEIDPVEVKFGSVNVGATASEEVTITNTGTVDLHLTFVGRPETVQLGGDCSAPIPVDGSCRLEFTLDTQAATSLADALTVVDEPNAVRKVIDVTATVALPPPITAAPTSPPTSAAASDTTITSTLPAVIPVPDRHDPPIALVMGLVAGLVFVAGFAVYAIRRTRVGRRHLPLPRIEVGETKVTPTDNEPDALPFCLISVGAVVTEISEEKS